MPATEPELITIIEGPTPEFRFSPQEWVQSIHEGPGSSIVATCQLRTGNGEDIMDRCRRAWQELRPVKLDFPDELRMRQQVDVLAAKLEATNEGPVLNIWVSLPPEYDDEGDDDDAIDYDDDDDDDNIAF